MAQFGHPYLMFIGFQNELRDPQRLLKHLRKMYFDSYDGYTLVYWDGL